MSDEYVELRIPVSQKDREDFSYLVTLMGEHFIDFDGAIRGLISSEEISSIEVNESYRSFRGAADSWMSLAARLSILNIAAPKHPEIGEEPTYYPREGLTGHYREQAQRVLRDFHHVISLFEVCNSLSNARSRLWRERLEREVTDDLPF